MADELSVSGVCWMRVSSWLFNIVSGVALSVCVLSTASFWSAEQERLKITTREVYDSQLQRIQTIDQMMQELGTMPGSSNMARVENLEDLLRARFYYGYARYSFRENWVAWLAARTVNPDLDAKTDAREIIESPWAACSQQALVVQEALRRMNLPYASVAFPKHFTAAVQIDGTWYVVDPWEPLERDRSRLFALSEWQSATSRAKFLSPAALAVWEPALVKSAPRLMHVNTNPAPTMAWFQPLTEVLSKWLWVPAFLWLLFQARATMFNIVTRKRRPGVMSVFV